MSLQTRPLTADELDQFPNDGERREIIEGELYVTAGPAKKHQRLLGRLHVAFYEAVEVPRLGEVYMSPVDVRFSDGDQVQPDLIVLLGERVNIYQGHIVFGPPDLIVEILSPSNRSYDEVEKARLYAANGVPEYWIADPDAPALRPQALVEGRYVPIEPDADGRFRSIVVPGLILDPARLFAGLT